ncbi:MAG: DnaA/Hda family protein [Fimbriimonas sp.]
MSVSESGVSGRRSPDCAQSDTHTFENFAPLPSNGHAVEAGLHFSAGLIDLVAIVGPSGWGKTHLLDAIVARTNQRMGANAARFDVHRALAAPGRLDSHRALLLDDVQEVFGKPKLRQMLGVMLERRIKSGRPTVLSFTADKPTRQLRQFLPSSRDWSVASITVPAPQERVLIINQLSSASGLTLSRDLVQILARHMHGNGCTLSGALKRLRLTGEDWISSRATLRACGVLNAFFSDNPEWDLQHKIIKTAAESPVLCPELRQDLALYTMMCVAGLPETEVARWAGVEPSTAYSRTMEFRKRLPSCNDASAGVAYVVDSVVSSLSAEETK